MAKCARTGILIGLCLMVIVPSVHAAGWYEDVTYKLGRGMTNIVTGCLELGNSIEMEIDQGGLYKGVSFGIIKGLTRMVARVGAGVYEVVTFPIEYPANYKPLIEPEFVFTKES